MHRGSLLGRYGSYTGYPWFLSDSTQRIVSLIEPSLVLSGDMHESCYYEHSFADGDRPASSQGAAVLPEWTVTSFNPLQGTQFPGFGILSLYSGPQRGATPSSSAHSHVSNRSVSFHHCFMCPVFYSAAGHAAAASTVVCSFMFRRLLKIAMVWKRGPSCLSVYTCRGGVTQ